MLLRAKRATADLFLYFCVEAVKALCTFISETANHDAIFFPTVIICTFFSFFAHLLLFGVLECWSLGLGFLGWGFHLVGLTACGVGPTCFNGVEAP